MKIIRRYLADDGCEYPTAQEALNADRRHQLGGSYDPEKVNLVIAEGASGSDALLGRTAIIAVIDEASFMEVTK